MMEKKTKLQRIIVNIGDENDKPAANCVRLKDEIWRLPRSRMKNV